MREAVIVATARTPIGKAYRGAFNDTQGQALAGHAIGEAVRRAGIQGADVEDVVMGCALQQGSTGFNVARQGTLWAGLPDGVPGTTMDRQCGSGLMAIAAAANRIQTGEARMTGHMLHEGKRRGAKYGIVTMCMGGGMGGAGLFEIF